MIKLSSLIPHEDNPRTITPIKLQELKESLDGFKKMMPIRPIVVDEDNKILAGNMKQVALIELGYEEVPNTWVKTVKGLTEDEKREFMVKDNHHAGDWDWSVVKNSDNWADIDIKAWGVSVDFTEPAYSPNYQPGNESKDVTAGDIEKTKSKLDTKFDGIAQTVEVTCPNCAETFHVNKNID